MKVKGVVDQRATVRLIDESYEFEVKMTEVAPPIPLWKVGLLLLAIIGGGAAYYVSREVRKR